MTHALGVERVAAGQAHLWPSMYSPRHTEHWLVGNRTHDHPDAEMSREALGMEATPGACHLVSGLCSRSVVTMGGDASRGDWLGGDTVR